MTEPRGPTPVAVSVLVCTRNRAATLAGCLDSLVGERPRASWELIVVDNGSTDSTADVIERCRSTASGVHVEHLVEERLGLSHSRNRAVAAARGELLLFTDDDVFVEPGWIDAMCSGFADPDVVAVAGRVVPEWPHPPPRWLLGRHAGLLALTDLGDAQRDLGDDEVPMGANMGIRAAALHSAAAPFDVRLGHRGSTFYAFEEHELFIALRSRGRFAYRPDSVVRHRVLPERMTWEGMRRACVHNGFGSRIAERLRGGPRVPLHTGVPALLRSYAAQRREARANGRRDDVAPERAWEEFRHLWDLGRLIEVVFGNSRLARWLVDRAV